jgi:hypothetical protein
MSMNTDEGTRGAASAPRGLEAALAALVSRVLRQVPISGYAPGLDAVRFLELPVLLSLLARLATAARRLAWILDNTARQPRASW